MSSKHPKAITMWDFSWLERRWPGAGYEDWDKALDELRERGYDSIRIDAFPHLIAEDPTRKYTLEPHWHTQRWGSPSINKVQVQPNLNEFIDKCEDRGLKIALSTWWREDQEGLAKKIETPEELGEVWRKTLESLKKKIS